MKEMLTSPSTVEQTSRPEKPRAMSSRLSGLGAWLFSVHADRWRRRAQFYERHRDYFPRLASGRFVDRCRELESAYRGLAWLLFPVSPQLRLVPVRVTVLRRK